MNFDRCFVVNLARRPDRLADFTRGIAAIGWPFGAIETVEAVDSSIVRSPLYYMEGGGAWGCLRSHHRILEDSLMRGDKMILVMEDDCQLVPDFTHRIGEFLASVPNDWAGLWLGGEIFAKHWTPGGAWKSSQKPQPIAPGVRRIFAVQRTHCYALRLPLMAELYKVWINLPVHLDWPLGEVFTRFPVYAPDPFIAGQRGGKSDVNPTSPAVPMRYWNG